MGGEEESDRDGVIKEGAFSAQIERGYKLLRFEKTLERDFRRGYDQENIVRAIFGIKVGFFLMLIDILFDFFFLYAGSPIGLQQQVLIFFFVAPVMLVGIRVLTKYSDRVRVALITLPCILIATVGLHYARTMAGTTPDHVPLLSFIVLLCFNFFLAGLTFLQVVVGAAIVSFGYLLSDPFYGMNTQLAGEQLYFLISIVVVGCISVYIGERTARANYLSAGVLSELSERDELTQLYNRRVFNRSLSSLIRLARREGRPLTLMLMDVDFFKKYNDHYGHAAGDVCLRKVADSLSLAAKRPLDVVARYGGEEFAIVLYGSRTGSVSVLAENVRQGIQQLRVPHVQSDHGVVTISIGVATAFVDDTVNEKILIETADEALYKAKAAGRNAAEFANLGDARDANKLSKKLTAAGSGGKEVESPAVPGASPRTSAVKQAVEAAVKDQTG